MSETPQKLGAGSLVLLIAVLGSGIALTGFGIAELVDHSLATTGPTNRSPQTTEVKSPESLAQAPTSTATQISQSRHRSQQLNFRRCEQRGSFQPSTAVHKSQCDGLRLRQKQSQLIDKYTLLIEDAEVPAFYQQRKARPIFARRLACRRRTGLNLWANSHADLRGSQALQNGGRDDQRKENSRRIGSDDPPGFEQHRRFA